MVRGSLGGLGAGLGGRKNGHAHSRTHSTVQWCRSGGGSTGGGRRSQAGDTGKAPDSETRWGEEEEEGGT